MSEQSSMLINNGDAGLEVDRRYDVFIQQAYLDPIRTVVVVDDEFPSLDGLIDKELKVQNGWNGQEADARKVREILEFCRNKPRPWLVDVHDGREFSSMGNPQIAPYLHHSDLVILDYHLEGDAGSGDRAIRILRELASNDHFNMVIVYTKGEQGDIQSVFRQIAIGLSHPKRTLEKVGTAGRHFEAVIADWEDDDPNIRDRLRSQLSEATYLELAKGVPLLELPEWSGIDAILKEYSGETPLDLPAMARWLSVDRQDSLKARLSDRDLGEISWNWLDGECNWVRTDRLFVTVVSKSHAPKDLPTKLAGAIKQWHPTPHQLLMARMRAQMDERGVLAESGVLRDRYLQAGWMQELFDESCVDKKHTLKNTVDRHWEALGDQLREGIDGFAGQVADYINTVGAESIFERFVKVDRVAEQRKVVKRLNEYTCMKSDVEHAHLMTGHILKFGNSELWACLTPACDLVPGQKTSGWMKRLGEYLPFMAVVLHKVEDEMALAAANQNIFIFMTKESDTHSFSFLPAGSIQANPTWEQMFAKNQGRFPESGKEIQIGRLSHKDGSLVFAERTAQVVGQLRYEYALNLLQRLGTNLSRVGLDYRVLSKPSEPHQPETVVVLPAIPLSSQLAGDELAVAPTAAVDADDIPSTQVVGPATDPDPLANAANDAHKAKMLNGPSRD